MTPGAEAEHTTPLVAAALILAVANFLIRPIILLLARPLGWVALLVVGFLALPVLAGMHGVPLAHLLHAVGAAAAFGAAGRLLCRFLARLRFLGERGRAEREGGSRGCADEEGTDCFHFKLLVGFGGNAIAMTARPGIWHAACVTSCNAEFPQRPGPSSPGISQGSTYLLFCFDAVS